MLLKTCDVLNSECTTELTPLLETWLLHEELIPLLHHVVLPEEGFGVEEMALVKLECPLPRCDDHECLCHIAEAVKSFAISDSLQPKRYVLRGCLVLLLLLFLRCLFMPLLVLPPLYSLDRVLFILCCLMIFVATLCCLLCCMTFNLRIL